MHIAFLAHGYGYIGIGVDYLQHCTNICLVYFIFRRALAFIFIGLYQKLASCIVGFLYSLAVVYSLPLWAAELDTNIFASKVRLCYMCFGIHLNRLELGYVTMSRTLF
jgi:hypothetical protein